MCASERKSDKPLGGGVKPPGDAGRGSHYKDPPTARTALNERVEAVRVGGVVEVYCYGCNGVSTTCYENP